MSFCDILKEYLSLTILFLQRQSTPLFILLDSYYESYKKEQIIELETNESPNQYVIEYDIIKMKYQVEDKHYIFCIDRKNPMNLQKVLETELIENKTHEDFFMMAELNEVDITSRLNMYVGSDGNHLQYNDIQIKWLLTQEEIATFEKLILIDQMCEETEYKSCNDFIKSL